MQQAEVCEKINAFPRWHYQFDLQGNLTPLKNPDDVNRHFQRKTYFFDPLVKQLGGSLAGKRVLDLGCNAGFWALSCAEAGAGEVIGIDGRQMHIDQANLVFEIKGIAKDRYKFIKGNVFDVDFSKFGYFDVVLCLGLLYHVRHPLLLFERIAQANKDILVIDTTITKIPGPYFQVRRESTDDPRNAVDLEVILRPSKDAVLVVARSFGYTAVVLKPQMTDWTRAKDYKRGRRRAFWCAKETCLMDLSVNVEESGGFVNRFKEAPSFARKIIGRAKDLIS